MRQISGLTCRRIGKSKRLTVYVFVSENMARSVKQSTQKVTILADVLVADHSYLDGYCQMVYSPETSLQAWKRMLVEDRIPIKCNVVVLMVGNSQIPFPAELSVSGQVKKLLLAIWEKYEKKLRKVVVSTVLPRPDKETEFEEEIKTVNNGIYKAVREIKRHHLVARNTTVIPLHRLFLERYEYFDFSQGRLAYQLRVVKPVSKYFKAGTAKLNVNGIYHLRSYLLQELGYLTGVNSWDGVPNRFEPKEIQECKRQAWLRTKDNRLIEEKEDDAESTDVEDEYPIRVVPDSQSDSLSKEGGSTDSSGVGLPVYVQGRLVPQGDVRARSPEKME